MVIAGLASPRLQRGALCSHHRQCGYRGREQPPNFSWWPLTRGRSAGNGPGPGSRTPFSAGPLRPGDAAMGPRLGDSQEPAGDPWAGWGVGDRSEAARGERWRLRGAVTGVFLGRRALGRRMQTPLRCAQSPQVTARPGPQVRRPPGRPPAAGTRVRARTAEQVLASAGSPRPEKPRGAGRWLPLEQRVSLGPRPGLLSAVAEPRSQLPSPLPAGAARCPSGRAARTALSLPTCQVSHGR